MEKNCLVTRLKTTVDNSGLEKLGVLNVNIANPNYYGSSLQKTAQDFSTVEGEEAKLVVDGGTITVSSPNEKISDVEATIKHGGKLIVLGDNTITHWGGSITNKYALEKLYGLYNCDSSDFKYINQIKKLYTIGMSGNISEVIEYIPNIEDFYIYSASNMNVTLYGKVSHLIGYLEELKYFHIGQTTNVAQSSIEEAVAIRRGLGQTSSTGQGVRIVIQNQSISFNGVYTPHSQKYLTWTPTTITLGSETINNDDVANV